MVFDLELMLDPNSRPPGFLLQRREWVTLNRFRTTQGRCAILMHRWGFVHSPECDCGVAEQTMQPILVDCPTRHFDGGLPELHRASEEATDYLRRLDLQL
jgi:hypothetical protein